jgi:hypothetical protein
LAAVWLRARRTHLTHATRASIPYRARLARRTICVWLLTRTALIALPDCTGEADATRDTSRPLRVRLEAIATYRACAIRAGRSTTALLT